MPVELVVVSVDEDMPLDEFVVSVEFRVEEPLVDGVLALVEPVPLAPMLVVLLLLSEDAVLLL